MTKDLVKKHALIQTGKVFFFFFFFITLKTRVE